DLDNGRYPVLGGFLQRRGGTVRHDAVAWGYARAASEAGADVIEHCEVTGIRREGARVSGVETTRGAIGAEIGGLAVAGHSSGLARVRVLRQWGGVMDMSMDGSPIISKTPLEGLILNGGWCYGGFKAIPAGGLTTAHLIARDEPHPLASHLDLRRFAAGRTVDERGAGPFPYAH